MGHMFEQKHRDLFLKIFGVVGTLYALTVIIFPNFSMDLMWKWKNTPVSGTPILLQGWGLTLLGLAFISYKTSNFTSEVKRTFLIGMFVYFGPLTIFWLVDMIMRGLVFFGVVTFFVALFFGSGSGYFAFLFKESET